MASLTSGFEREQKHPKRINQRQSHLDTLAASIRIGFFLTRTITWTNVVVAAVAACVLVLLKRESASPISERRLTRRHGAE